MGEFGTILSKAGISLSAGSLLARIGDFSVLLKILVLVTDMVNYNCSSVVIK